VLPQRRSGLNSVYITLGVAVILALVTALVGPFFVDWTAYRSTFESYAQRTLGHRVTVLGDADLRLLPSPMVVFNDVRVGEAEDPLLVVSKFEMRVELPPLMKGEVRVIDMRLERPHLSLSLDESGRLDWLTAMARGGALSRLDSKDVMFEKVDIIDGALSLVDARNGDIHELTNANLLIGARTLDGPFKIDGSVSHKGAPYSLRVGTGKRQADGAIRVKGQIVPNLVPLELAVDGLLAEDDGAPVFEGTFGVASVNAEEDLDQAWQAEGRFQADVSRLAVPEFLYRFGPEDRLLSLNGEADMKLAGQKRFEVRATAKQVDLDRIYGEGPVAPVSLDDAGRHLLSGLSKIAIPQMDGVIALDIPAVVVGGGIAQNVKLDLETTLGGWRIARLAGRLPGRTMLTTQGNLGLDPEVTYNGSLSLRSEQPGTFFSWWRQEGKGTTAIQTVSLEGRLNVVPEGVALNQMRIGLSDTSATGALSYRRPRNNRPEFTLTLDADKLDVDQVEELYQVLASSTEGGSSPIAGSEVSLRVQAQEVAVRGIDGKGLSLEAQISGDQLRIDRLFAEDFAGSEIDVGGAINNLSTAPEGLVSGTLNATDLTGVIALLEGAFPDSELVGRLKKASPHLVPARMNARLQAAAADGRSRAKFAVDGEIGSGTAKVSGDFDGRVDAWRDARVNIDTRLGGPDGAELLRQLGFDVLQVAELGEAALSLSAFGRPGDGLDVTVNTEVGAGRLDLEGSIRFEENEPLGYKLSGTASADDLAPYALMAGRVLPVFAGDIEADLGFRIEGEGTEISVTDISGSVAGAQIEANIKGNLEPPPGASRRRLAGNLNASAIDIRFLSEAILGPDQWYAAGDGSSVWPNGSFGAPLLSKTELSLELSADRLVVDDENAISNAQADFRLTPEVLRLDALRGTFAGGKLSGNTAITRSGAEAAFNGNLKLEDALLSDLAWSSEGRALASGQTDVFLEFEGAGRSISGIVSGLAGGGTLSVTDGNIRGINPTAFGLVIRAADAGLELEDDKIRSVFANHLDAGNLPFTQMVGALSIAAGRAVARNISVDADSAALFGSAELDLNNWSIESDVSLKVDPGENAVTGAEPQVGILFSGTLDEPSRSIDITPFTAFLTLRAFEQEVERVEKLQAEILERDRLLREMKRQRQVEARRKREAEEERLRLLELEEQEQEGGETETGEVAAPDGASPVLVQPLDAEPDTNAPGTAAPEAEASRDKTEAPDSAVTDPVTETATLTPETGELPPLDAPTEEAAEPQVPEALPFADQIRAVIETDADPAPAEENTDIDAADVTGSTGTAAVSDALPPLEPAGEIGSLLAREIGVPDNAVQNGGGFDLGARPQVIEPVGDPVVLQETVPRRTNRQVRRQQPRKPAVPRYITRPNGLVIENPNWSAN